MNDIQKLLAFKKDARSKLFKGVTILNDAVTTTLSPKGRNVAIQRQWGSPIVVHDGVTVAREVGHKDELVLMGIRLVQHAAQKTNDEAGDGTTTATLLAYEIVKRGLKLIDAGHNPMIIRNQIYEQLPNLLKGLEEISTKLKGKKDIERVAYISSADKEIGSLVAEAVNKVGKDGMVTVEEGRTFSHSIEYTEGMEIDRGFISPYFITNEQRMEAVIKEPAVAVINKKISFAAEIVPILEEMAKVTKDIVIVCLDMSGDALATAVHNKMKGNINCLVTKSPLDVHKGEAMEDIGVIVGAKVLDDKKGINIKVDQDWIGRADKVVASRDTAVIIGGKGKKSDVDKRVDALRTQIKEEKADYEREKAEKRLARMTTGIAVVKVGAKTEIDMREKVERVKDAVGAATSAREEGVVPGGGIAFLKLMKYLDGDNPGTNLMYDVLGSPLSKILENCGEESPTEIIVEIDKKGGNFGYEVMSGKVVDLVEEGIIDPAKVVRLALENAIGVATSILTTDCLIAHKEAEIERNPRR